MTLSTSQKAGTLYISAPAFAFNSPTLRQRKWRKGLPSMDDKSDTQTNDQTQTTPTAGGDSGKFTQEQVNQFVAERAKHAVSKAITDLLEALGVKDADEAKAIIKARREAEEQQKTETQKLTEQITKLEEKAQRIETEAEKQIAEMRKRLLDSEIRQAAAQPVKDKDGKVLRQAFRPDALEDLLTLMDRSKIEEKEGKYEGIEKALAEFAKARPHWLDGKPQNSKGTPLPEKQSPLQPGEKQPSLLIRSL